VSVDGSDELPVRTWLEAADIYVFPHNGAILSAEAFTHALVSGKPFISTPSAAQSERQDYKVVPASY